MKHVVHHDLPADEARDVAERAFLHYRERYAKYQPRLHWQSDTEAQASFRAKGLKVQAKVELLPRAIGVELDVPFVFRVFKTRAVAIVEREVRHWCAEARATRSS